MEGIFAEKEEEGIKRIHPPPPTAQQKYESFLNLQKKTSPKLPSAPDFCGGERDAELPLPRASRMFLQSLNVYDHRTDSPSPRASRMLLLSLCRPSNHFRPSK